MEPLPTIVLGALLAIIVVQRLTELRLARRNEAWVRAEGAVEVGARHYPLFFVLHTGWLLAWPLEAWRSGPTLAPWWGAALGVFVGAEALRYWAIGTLGKRWNTRILVLPSRPPIRRGPYRWLAHPNYVAVVLELAAAPLIFGAWWTAVVVGALNLALLLGIRIPAETAALRAATIAILGPMASHYPREERRWQPAKWAGVEACGTGDHPYSGASLFRMAAGARIDWHEHPRGEHTYVIAGEAMFGTQRVGAGDVLYTLPGEGHAVEALTDVVFFGVAPR